MQNQEFQAGLLKWPFDKDSQWPYCIQSYCWQWYTHFIILYTSIYWSHILLPCMLYLNEYNCSWYSCSMRSWPVKPRSLGTVQNHHGAPRQWIMSWKKSRARSDGIKSNRDSDSRLFRRHCRRWRTNMVLRSQYLRLVPCPPSWYNEKVHPQGYDVYYFPVVYTNLVTKPSSAHNSVTNLTRYVTVTVTDAAFFCSVITAVRVYCLLLLM